MTRIAALGCFFVAVLASCGSGDSSPPQSIDLGAEVTLAPGAAAAFKPAGIVVQFVSVVTDSRCPREVTCMWAGEVKVLLSIQDSQQPPRRQEILEGGHVVSGDYRVTVVRVQPEPASSGKIPRESYRATLQLQKI
ncbi:MAG: hypothetical protein SXG53_22325 [Pseudomonadota bacterium]|nr:hypothetical protein [Pseudomonadota bacterium]